MHRRAPQDCLEPIRALQSVLQAGQFQAAEDATRLLLERYPSDGLAIVRCAILFRPDGALRPYEKKAYEKSAIEFHRRLEAVKKMESGGPPPSVDGAEGDEQDKQPAPKPGFFGRMFGFGKKDKKDAKDSKKA